MNIINLTLANIKRYLKSPHLILPMIFVPLVMIFFVSSSVNNSNGSLFEQQIALVCNKDGKYESKLIDELGDNMTLFDIKDKEKAIDLLKNNDISSVIVLNNNFSVDIDNSVSPKVTSFKTSNGGGSLLTESNINKFISKSLKYKEDGNINTSIITSNIIKKESSLLGSDVLSVFMISYFLYLCSGVFCMDLLSLRKSNVLRRMLSTKNKDFHIIFSLCFSLFLVQAFFSSLALILANIIHGDNISIPTILLICANSFVSTGLVIFICRLFKKESYVFLTTSFYCLISIILCLGDLLPSLNINSQLFNKLSMISPFYWIFEVANGGNIYISIFALLLMGLVFMTCGSFKLKDFARN
ncbi:ABC transporter permease [Romboutsia sp. Marseille-P6047]|uniref:ABC transporter permease n=1 Tax=Romboutsia sp. Marseille-P6047 TaxID=2161817 RepID=UPI000F062500|nr:ABC transporter permease [Romboutsia sp. Marseille-P6047]